MSALHRHIQNQQDAATAIEGILSALHSPDSIIKPHDREHLLFAALVLSARLGDALDSVSLPKEGVA